jgi:cation diffusion facilitator CzcD-associated flavoprotein CzcO
MLTSMNQPAPSTVANSPNKAAAEVALPGVQPRAGYAHKFCVLGAGSSGLTVLKNLRQAGIPCECLEREDDIGGNWYYGRPASSVYRSAHLISSKRLTEYTDFPMPKDYPPFPSQQQVWAYLRSYAEHFQLYPHIEFNTSVTKIAPAGDLWDITLATGEIRRYRGVVIANGHNWDPKWPQYPGEFHGTILHSSQYKTPEALVDKRVLVVGAGNSGCDIAVESAQFAARTLHSMRRGYHFLPKFLHGKPIDVCNERLLRWRLPLAVRRFISYWAVRFALGTPQMYGLPQPDHRLFETHPIINSQMLYQVGHGRITPKPEIAELCGDGVRFVDGTHEAVDVIVYATGFNITFPFCDAEHLNWHDRRPDLYLHVFHPQRDNLFVAGLIQPDSGQWGIVDCQAQLIASYLQSIDEQKPQADWFRKLKRSATEPVEHGIRYVDSTRHLLEVEHFSYRRTLEKLVRKLRGYSNCK